MISATARALSAVRRKSGLPAAARSANRATASTAARLSRSGDDRIRKRERWDRKLLLSVDVQGNAARDQRLELRARPLKRGSTNLGAASSDLLEVVQHEEDVLQSQMIPQRVEEWAPRLLGDAERRGRLGATSSASVTEERSTKKTPSRKSVRASPATASASLVLPVPPGPGQGHETVPREQLADPADLLGPGR